MDYLMENSCTRNSCVIKKLVGKGVIVPGSWEFVITIYNDRNMNHKYGEFVDTRTYRKHTSKDKKKK